MQIPEERRVAGDFEYLVLHVTQSVPTQRGCIIAWVARVSIDEKVGPTEGRPVHVPEVARMVLEYQKKETPYGSWVLESGTKSVMVLSWMALMNEVLTHNTDETTARRPPADGGMVA